MAFSKSKDRWSFLEEIEAPMWVDLTLETNSIDQDINDDWFQTSHQFHQWSASKLKLMFSHPGLEVMTTMSALQGPSSPKLPSSVSRSRGKHYRSKQWREDNVGISVNKQHPVRILKGDSFPVSFKSDQEAKPKINSLNSKGISPSKSGLVCERVRRNSIHNSSKHISTCKNMEFCSSASGNRTLGSNTRSTVTTEDSLQQEKFMEEVSSRPVGHEKGLLSSMRSCLNRSQVTRKPLQVDITEKCMQSRQRKSSSGKSSVGSNSKPSHKIKISAFTSTQPMESTPKSRNTARRTLAAENKMICDGSNTFTVIVDKEQVDILRASKRNNTSANEAAKLKTQHRTALALVRVNRLNPFTNTMQVKEKQRIERKNIIGAVGKENATRSKVMHQKCSSQYPDGSMVTIQKSMGVGVLQKNKSRTSSFKISGIS